jgi:hypothetical protein
MHTPHRVAIRVDGSAAMGTGHLKRCLSLMQAHVEQRSQIFMVACKLHDVRAQVLGDKPCLVDWRPAPSDSFQTDGTSSPQATWAGVTWMQDASNTKSAPRISPPDWLVVDRDALGSRWHGASRNSLGGQLLAVRCAAGRSSGRQHSLRACGDQPPGCLALHRSAGSGSGSRAAHAASRRAANAPHRIGAVHGGRLRDRGQHPVKETFREQRLPWRTVALPQSHRAGPGEPPAKPRSTT